jgi:hypothetical protein
MLVFKIILSAIFYFTIIGYLPMKIDEKISKLSGQPKKEVYQIRFGIIFLGVPVLFGIIYSIFSHLKIFPDFTHSLYLLAEDIIEQRYVFSFLLWGFIFAPWLISVFATAMAIDIIFIIIFVGAMIYIYNIFISKINSGFVRNVYIVSCIIIFYIGYSYFGYLIDKLISK